MKPNLILMVAILFSASLYASPTPEEIQISKIVPRGYLQNQTMPRGTLYGRITPTFNELTQEEELIFEKCFYGEESVCSHIGPKESYHQGDLEALHQIQKNSTYFSAGGTLALVVLGGHFGSKLSISRYGAKVEPIRSVRTNNNFGVLKNFTARAWNVVVGTIGGSAGAAAGGASTIFIPTLNFSRQVRTLRTFNRITSGEIYEVRNPTRTIGEIENLLNRL